MGLVTEVDGATYTIESHDLLINSYNEPTVSQCPTHRHHIFRTVTVILLLHYFDSEVKWACLRRGDEPHVGYQYSLQQYIH
jgi:hypothetical protein